jgi:pyruvate-formate lyase
MATKTYRLDPASVGIIPEIVGNPTSKGWELVTPEMWKFRWSVADKIMTDSPEMPYFKDVDWYIDVTRPMIMTKLREENPNISNLDLVVESTLKVFQEQRIFVRPYELVVGNGHGDTHGISWDDAVQAWQLLQHAKEAGESVDPQGRICQWVSGKKTPLSETDFERLAKHSTTRNVMFRMMEKMTPEEIQYYFCPQEPGRYFESVGSLGLRATPDNEWWLPLGLRKLVEMKRESKRRFEEELKGVSGEKAEDLKRRIKNCEASIRVTEEGVIPWVRRHAQAVRELLPTIKEEHIRKAMEQVAENCEWVAENAPRTYWEAVQLYWLVFVCVYTIETAVSSQAFHLDRAMSRYYLEDMKAGRVDRVRAAEILACWMAKYHEVCGTLSRFGPVGKAGQGTRDYTVWTIGGVDKFGHDYTNDFTRLVWDTVDGYRLHFPDIKHRWHMKTSRKDMERFSEVMRTGLGTPAFRNDEVVIPASLDQYPGLANLEEWRSWAVVGCMTPGPTIHSLGSNRRSACAIQFSKSVEFALFNGRDPGPGFEWFKSIETGDPTKFKDFDEFYNAWLKQWEWIGLTEIRLRNIGCIIWRETVRRPFISLLYERCMASGNDTMEELAPKFSFQTYVGMVDVVDSLTAVKYWIYDKKKYTMEQLVKALKAEWEGYEGMRKDFKAAPKFGNDDDYADSMHQRCSADIYQIGKRTIDDEGNPTFLNILPVSLIYMAAPMVGALPNGRKRGEALCDGGFNPHAEFDKGGSWARLRSAMKVDQTKYRAGIYNQKIDWNSIKGDAGLQKFTDFIQAGLMGGMSHMQFNTLSKEVYRDAQEHPEKYPYLSVRVSGYTAFFTPLPRFMQDAIIARADHTL